MNLWLLAAGVLSAGASLLHLAAIGGGASWYRALGAGEGMARMAERGALYPTVITLGIAAVLAVWSAYAFAGAGLLPRLPLMRWALAAITTVFVLGALVFVPALWAMQGSVDAFAIWSSLIVAVYALTYGVGSWRAWSTL